MKLTIELVPQTSWFENLRSILTSEKWDKLRRETYRKANYRCEICGSKGPKHPVECHEIWNYDDKKHRQTLTGLIALCPNCHRVKHIGLAQVQGKYDIAFRHLMKVNRWTAQQTDRHIEAAIDQWNCRNEFEWEVDISWIKKRQSEHPAVAIFGPSRTTWR